MPKSSDDPKTSGTNPNTTSKDGGINPSAPTTGTEGWGTTSDERRTLDTNDPVATRSGQMKGNPGDNLTEASQRASARATTNEAADADRRSDPGGEQADLSRRTSASAYSMNTSHGGTDRTFRCADAGNSDCRWETSGSTEDEIMQHVEEHGRKEHGMADWTEAMRSKVRDNIRKREAA